MGTVPIADRLLEPGRETERELGAPLTLTRCSACQLVQIAETVPPEILFCEDYPYYSSVSPALVAHFRESALTLIGQLRLDTHSLVVEAASNDGYMLANFVDRGIPVLGVDPAAGPAATAAKRGIPMREAFFGVNLARQLRAELRRGADLFIANNVLAHVADLRGFVAGIREILAPDGVAVIEFPYLADLVTKTEFDTIYHQHLCYFSLRPLRKLFASEELTIVDAKRIPIHGGSVRICVRHRGTMSARLRSLLDGERSDPALSAAGLRAFVEKSQQITTELKDWLRDAAAKGVTVAAYGAAAKATTMLAMARVERRDILWIADRNPHKHGLLMAGSRIPIVPVAQLERDRPKALLLLAWNFAEEIVAQLQTYRKQGGRFFKPVPALREVVPQ